MNVCLLMNYFDGLKNLNLHRYKKCVYCRNKQEVCCPC